MPDPTYGPVHRGGEGSPLVLLHGASATWRVWRPVIPLLEHRHALYVPTLAGHRGGTLLPSGERASVRRLVDALERQLDAAGIGAAHVAGNSLGGWLALELARRGRARSVVALAPAGAWSRPSDLRVLRAKARAGHRASKVLGRGAGLVVLVPGARQVLLRPLARTPRPLERREAAELLRAAAECSVLPQLLELADGPQGFEPLTDPGCPVTIAWGELDRVLPFARYGRPMLELVPQARSVVLPRAGHVPMLDRPQVVADLVLDVTGAVDALDGHP